MRQQARPCCSPGSEAEGDAGVGVWTRDERAGRRAVTTERRALLVPAIGRQFLLILNRIREWIRVCLAKRVDCNRAQDACRCACYFMKWHTHNDGTAKGTVEFKKRLRSRLI